MSERRWDKVHTRCTYATLEESIYGESRHDVVLGICSFVPTTRRFSSALLVVSEIFYVCFAAYDDRQRFLFSLLELSEMK